MADLKQDFEERGYAVFRGLLSPDEVARYRAEIQALSGVADLDFGAKVFTCADGITQNQAFWPLIYDSRLLEAVRALIGPSIGPCCFVIRDDVALPLKSQFPDRSVVLRDGPRMTGDLREANRAALEGGGVPTEHILVTGLCTACDTDRFFSHRKERGRTGVMVSVLYKIDL